MDRIKEAIGCAGRGWADQTCRSKGDHGGPITRAGLVTTVGFEPTPLARPAPKAGALDHSATLSGNIASRLDN